MGDASSLKNTAYGFITTDSTSSTLVLTAYSSSANVPVVGRMLIADIELEDGYYRALGTVTDIRTQNAELGLSSFSSVSAQGHIQGLVNAPDTRTFAMKIQSTFYRQTPNDIWQPASSAFPTSPATQTPVYLLNYEFIQDTIGHSENLISLGHMRGLPGVDTPLTLPDFSSQVGARHSAILGRSGSGKTAFATYVLSSQMSHESHAIIVIDPQGQWANENGFLFSVQEFARKLGRDVSVLRVAEDVRLPLDEEILGELFAHVDLWGRGFRRMGAENKAAFSEEVARLIIQKVRTQEIDLNNFEPKELLTEIFVSIAKSAGAMRRIYASQGSLDTFREDLLRQAGQPPTMEDDFGEVIEGELTEEDLQDIEMTWNSLLPKFIPLISLFSPKNLNGKPRQALGGQAGFLTKVMQSRPVDPDHPAPYVVLDMSTDVTMQARGDYASLTKAGDIQEQINLQMRTMLDNEDIKALIVTAVLEEIKKSSEVAFSQGGQNLNTQIVFDEAWRYAPNTGGLKEDDPIRKLSTTLGGFALDTRKYGIGWTYILQSPSDLNTVIWKQLSFVYSGYGVISYDKKMLAELMDESEQRSQMGLYDQFTPPTSTGRYPFMITGPISPLIFTNTPVFIDAFTSPQEFLDANEHWINRITQRRNLLPLNNSDQIVKNVKRTMAARSKNQTTTINKATSEEKTINLTPKKDTRSKPPTEQGFRIGKSEKASKTSTPQHTTIKKRKKPTHPTHDFNIEPPPF